MTAPDDPRSDGSASHSPNPLTQTFRDLFVLGLGLLVGFFWYLYNEVGDNVDEPENVIIGLIIIVGFMFRYLALMRAHGGFGGNGRTAAVMAFVRELIVFVSGLALGLFWYQFYSDKGGAEIHIIIALLVLIFAIARYMYLLREASAAKEIDR
jgi:hypothetical protein